VVKRDFVPDAGDLIWLTFDPQAGREQAGRRPALVLSPRNYNARSGLSLACPVTSQVKGYPFEVPLPEGSGVSGVILADQLKSIDWKVRRAERCAPCPGEVLDEVRAKLAALLGF
jgi:mRNA interferase MazF